MDYENLENTENGNHSESNDTYICSGPVRKYPPNSAMAFVFDRQALMFPDNIAVIFEDRRLSYRDLDWSANQVAQLVAEKLAQKRRPDIVVALCLERSDVMVVAILALLKAGVAYVAIDPKYPPQRIQFILEDTAAVMMLTDDMNFQFIKSHMEENLILNLSNITFPPKNPIGPPESVGTTDIHVSHILYTSGTTGKPKGVLVTREALITECVDYGPRYGIKPGDSEVVVHLLNYVFNAATVPFLTALSNGFPLVVVRPSLIYETEKFYDYLQRHGVTHIDGTPSLVARFDLARIPTLKRIAVGGEALTAETFRQFKAMAPQAMVFNIFGNSEGSICVQHQKVETEEVVRRFGIVAHNKRCYLLNTTTNQLVRTGEIGELAVSGRGLALGYMNNVALTEERFISNPFQTLEDRKQGLHSMLYRTGDLFRLLPSGIESCGRKDHQIKIRGYRVELEEIGNVIRSFPGVIQSVVIATNLDKSEQAALIGYFVFKDEKMEDENEDAILKYIRTLLPEYMVPSRLVQLAEMPLNCNGKIDRSGLPLPPPRATNKSTITSSSVTSLTPSVTSEALVTSLTSDTEMRSFMSADESDRILNPLITIWREILNLAPTDEYEMDADFFETGGNSLLAMRLVERVNTEMGFAVDAAYVFKFSTIAEFRENLTL